MDYRIESQCDTKTSCPQLFRKQEISDTDYLHVSIYPGLYGQWEVSSVSEINSDQFVGEFSCPTPAWCCISFSMLNLNLGLHTYRISLSDKVFGTQSEVYFSYLIQDSNPNKPYIYMDRPEDQ